MAQQGVIKTAKKLGLFAVAMFGFGFAMVPIYSVLCEVTGIGGKTGVISQSEASADEVDADRLVTVEFDSNVHPDLPWKFKALKYKMSVHPGEMSEAIFIVENKSDKAVVGKAVPSVAPEKASVYFNKTECFCFTKQLLEPGERKEMIVRFIVGSELPEDILIMTLSYTFFLVTDNADVAASDTKAVKTIS
ncbi:MAG TPA: cytochrome c oxidase assembly protein [Thiotrichaceae bacterium]|jgi:cytochrome c oxidase assembly protein subunit 11|nr:cytochrome c oxidase assembly protein [Thiotrichaceae bacterium]HIM08456.1 cytochrome c oxidase assembly protein [Gammaproteobacteria bacterium]